MEKKIIYMMFTVVIISLVVGCSGNGDDATALGIPDESEILTAEPEAETEIETTKDDSGQEDAEFFDEAADELLLAWSSDPEFEEFVDMLYVNPENYLDKSVTVSGDYLGYYAEYMGRYVHHIYKWDEMGCCPLMMEFMLNGDFPEEDFLKEDTPIEITGVYSSYEDEGFDWINYYVAVDTITVLDGGNPQ